MKDKNVEAENIASFLLQNLSDTFMREQSFKTSEKFDDQTSPQNTLKVERKVFEKKVFKF